MATLEDSLQVFAAIGWEQQQTGDFAALKQGPDRLLFQIEPDAAIWTEILVDQFTLAAAATQTMNLNAFTNLLNLSVTARSAVRFLMIKATGEDGELTIEPGATEPIDFWLTGTAPALVVGCGTDGCAVMIADGVSRDIDSAVKNIDITNSGTEEIVVQFVALVRN